MSLCLQGRNLTMLLEPFPQTNCFYLRIKYKGSHLLARTSLGFDMRPEVLLPHLHKDWDSRSEGPRLAYEVDPGVVICCLSFYFCRMWWFSFFFFAQYYSYLASNNIILTLNGVL